MAVQARRAARGVFDVLVRSVGRVILHSLVHPETRVTETNMKSLLAVIVTISLALPAVAQEGADEGGAAQPEPLVKLRNGETSVVDPESGDEIEVPYQIYDGPASFKITVPKVIRDESELPPEQTEALMKLKLSDPPAYEAELARITEELQQYDMELPLATNYKDASYNTDHRLLMSMEFVGQRGKFVDDGVYAAMELALEDGIEKKFPRGKRAWVHEVAQQILYRWSDSSGDEAEIYRRALVWVATAELLGGAEPEPKVLNLTSDVIADAQAQADAFLAEQPLQSRPIGFYTWSEELQRIYTRDRWLMQPLDVTDPADLMLLLVFVDVMERDEELTLYKELKKINEIYAAMSNPGRGLRVVDFFDDARGAEKLITKERAREKWFEDVRKDEPYHLFPPSRTREAELIERLGGTDAVAGESMDAMIAALRSGDIALLPSVESGWYDWQQYALEVLVKLDEMPEGTKIDPDEGYQQRLEMAFAAMLTQNRETHVKQLEMVPTSATMPAPLVAEVTVQPSFAIEPLPSYYLRVMDAYGFLYEKALTGNLADYWQDYHPWIDGAPDEDQNLADAIKEIRDLYAGLYLAASMDIGMIPNTEALDVADPRIAVRDAVVWSQNWHKPGGDPLMAEDVRVIVPVGVTRSGGLLCWAVLGVKPLNVTIEYADPPRVSPLVEGVEVKVVTEPVDYTMLVPVFAEVVLPTQTPPTRDEFRALCDEQMTESDIREALASWGTEPSEPEAAEAAGEPAEGEAGEPAEEPATGEATEASAP